MKEPTLISKSNGEALSVIHVQQTIGIAEIENAIGLLLWTGEDITHDNVLDTIVSVLTLKGKSGLLSFLGEDDIKQYAKLAEYHARKLYPTYYQVFDKITYSKS